jgi:hypothetical protein
LSNLFGLIGERRFRVNVFSFSLLSIDNFGVVWIAHLLVFGGAAFTVAVFRESEKRLAVIEASTNDLIAGSRCVLKMDSEA